MTLSVSVVHSLFIYENLFQGSSKEVMHIHNAELVIYDSRKLSKLEFPSFLGGKWGPATFRTALASEQFRPGGSPWVTSSCPRPQWKEDVLVTSCNWAPLTQGTGEGVTVPAPTRRSEDFEH